MGLLLKIAIFAVVVYGIWKTARRWYHLFGGGQKPPAPPQRNPPPQNPPEPRRVVVEDTLMCPACGAYVSTTAAKCGRSDCPQAA